MRNKTTAALFAFFLGGIGGHKFYLGQTGWGVVYLLTCWTFLPALVAFIEFIMLLTMGQEEFDRRFNAGMAPAPMLAQPQNIVVNVAQNALPAGGMGAIADRTAQLKQLHDLRVSGALTDEEFAVEKQKLLTGRTDR